jgi:DNA invertase Pin-like site-specific DNA recombinase
MLYRQSTLTALNETVLAGAYAVVGYARHSTEGQKFSCGRQIEKILEYAEANRLPKPVIFKDEAKSGTLIVGRDGYDAMWEYIAGHSLGALMAVEDMSRVTRGLSALGLHLKRRDEFDVIVHDVKRGPLDDGEELEEALKSHKNYMEFLIKAREGRVQAARRGEWLTVVPFGFLIGKDGRLRVNPVTSGYVKLIFAMRADMKNWTEIARKLDELGVVPPRGGANWAISTVRNIVHNPIYTGGKTYIPGKYKWEKRIERHTHALQMLGR